MEWGGKSRRVDMLVTLANLRENPESVSHSISLSQFLARPGATSPRSIQDFVADRIARVMMHALRVRRLRAGTKMSES